MTWTLLHGDCRTLMAEMEGCSVDSVVTDPPYELTSARPGGRSPATEGKVMKGFMGMEWDGSGVAYDVAMWREVLRVLKPGGWLVSFGGTRTYHRMAYAIEGAGFEVRDRVLEEVAASTKFGPLWDSLTDAQRGALVELLNDFADPLGSDLAWVFGSGFPKGGNHDGKGTCLKPAHEPIVLARKPLVGSVAANEAAFGTGALNIDACRVATSDALGGGRLSGATPVGEGWDRPWMHDTSRRQSDADRMADKVQKAEQLGRWPANIVHDGSDEVLQAFPNAPGQQGDLRGHSKCRQSPNGIFGGMPPALDHAARRDTGSAARFFYCAKASKADRDEGLDGFDPQAFVQFQTGNGESGRASSLSDGRSTEYRNTHPTVKPEALMRWLVRLVTPVGGLVLDPFTGSGSTGKAAMLEGRRFVGCELTDAYLPIARARIGHAEARAAADAAPPPQSDLFTGEAA